MPGRDKAGTLRVRMAATATVLVLLACPSSRAAETSCTGVGEIVSIEGRVERQRGESSGWSAAAPGERLCREDSVRTLNASRAAIALVNDAVLRLDADTTLRLADVPAEPGGRSLIELIFGALQSFSRKPREIDVGTPFMNLAVRGTEFLARTDGNQSFLTVIEGEVAASNALGSLTVAGGGSARAQAGEPPRPWLLVQSAEVVEWALFYPPLHAPQNERLARAEALLAVGRLPEARAAIDEALAADPDDALALALRSVIAVAQNREAEALADGARAVELAPGSAATRVALSFAQQAAFDLRGARDTLQAAVAAEPGNALAWARLGEVWLMLGENERGREAALRAVEIEPELARAQTVLGFADLTQLRTRTARAAFERAILLDAADPLPRLGLGLARIRDGELTAGRRELDIAVALDPGRSILRSYLGRAYIEEGRDELGQQQLALARRLDPKDPSPDLFDAIAKQRRNRPVEALDDLARSIALNDNRAVYRDGLLLAEDRAARGTALARVLDDLGFRELGLREADRALAFDPGSSAAHRLRADLALGVRRRESTRVSELLQAQLLQEVNRHPVQPSLAETNLNIASAGGPAEVGFNEFTPLFQSDGVRFDSTGLLGNESTLGGEGVVTALKDGVSASAGLFGYRTDGWRDNNDIEHQIANVFLQAALSPTLNAQLEARHRSSEEGDLAFNFDPDDFSRQRKRRLDQDVLRLGLRHSPGPGSDLLLSYVHSRRNERIKDRDPFLDVSEFRSRARAKDRANQLETQHLFRREGFNLTAGAGHTEVDGRLRVDVDLDGAPFVDDSQAGQVHHSRGYLYGSAELPRPVTWTLGLSADRYREDDLSVDKLNPKLGIRWQVQDDVALRAAAFRYVKPALANNRTIEPTQVAGFDQLFDDANGTAAWRYGVGLDWRLGPRLNAGAEATWREISEPIFINDEARQEKRHEQLHRIYAAWAPLPRWSFHAALGFDRYTSEEDFGTEFAEIPEKVETTSLPLGVRYFHPSGWFAGGGVALVHQEVRRSPTSEFDDGSDSFAVVDASLGYRFRNRAGAVSLQVSNLLDQGFHYQDDSFREFRDEPSVGPYIPERQIRLRLTLSF